MRNPVTLDSTLRTQVLQKIGVADGLETDFEGLKVLYRAWCEGVPFDNAAKLIALRTGRAGNLPGIDAAEFFGNYLEHGFGGTCWPSSNGLIALFAACGFDVRRLAGSMRDTGIISHGSAKVHIDETDWLVDSSMLTQHPLPLTSDLFISSDPVWSAEVELADDTHVVWWDSVPSPEYIPCRMLTHEVTHDFYLERYEASRERSPFNERIYLRRNRPDSLVVISGNRRFVKSQRGVEATELTRDQLEDALVHQGGFSQEIVGILDECGAIDASMIPSQNPPPPPTRPRPSRRSHAGSTSL